MSYSTYLNKRMFGVFEKTRRDVLEALKERRQRSARPIAWIVIGVVSVNFLAIVLGIISGTDVKPYQEFSEGGFITYMSAGYMLTTGAFAFLCFLLRFRAANIGKWFWLLTSAGFFFFTVDEVLQIHENLGLLISDTVTDSVPGLRSWNDLLVISYGFAGIFVLLLFLPEVLRIARFAELVSIAFSFYIVHTAIDSIVLTQDIWKVAPEESAKLFSASFFALSMLVALFAMMKPLRINPDA